MAGIFKKLSANDIKITPFEAHKKYSSTTLSSIGVSTDFVSWAPYNKVYYLDGNRKYSQIDKLYYRDYIRERAHRLELDDATYTTQERRLYDFANVISFPQRNFGNEIQPSTFILSCSYSSSGEQFGIKDDGFGNLYDSAKGRDNFPNEDYRIIYISPTQAFKRADLTINYETGKKYVNNPFPKGYERIVYDDSYFLNEVEYKNINFVTSSNSGFYSVKTLSRSVNSSSIELPVSTNPRLEEGVGFHGDAIVNASNATDGDDSTFAYISGLISSKRGGFIFNLTTENHSINKIRFKNGTITGPYRIEYNPGTGYKTLKEHTFSGAESTENIEFPIDVPITSIRISAEAVGTAITDAPQIYEIDFFEVPYQETKSRVQIPYQPQFNFETNDDFTINFYYDVNYRDHQNSSHDGDYFILTKEGTKTVASLPSEKTQDVSLRITGSSQIGMVPVGNQFPYRIYYKGNHPSANTASLFFERSDGEKTQFVSASFLLSGSSDKQNFVSCKNDNGILKLKINAETETSSSGQNSPTLNKTVSNKADITLYNKPNPDGSYSNYIGQGCGQISQLMMWNQTLSGDGIVNVSESIVGTPNIGNIFYDNGFAVVTHPSYKNVLNNYDFNGYTSVTSASISSSALGFDAPTGGTFNGDGTKLILVSSVSDTTIEFTLDTPYDVTSFTTSQSFDDTEIAEALHSIIFNNDGSKVYMSRTTPVDRITSFSLSSSYDLGSRYNKNEILISTPNSDDLRGIAWSNDGTKFYTTTVNGDINQYTSKDPFDLDNIVYDCTYNLGHTGDVGGIRFDNSGYKMFIIHSSDDTNSPWQDNYSYLTQYVLDRPFDIKSININNRLNSVRGIHAIGGNSANIINRPSDILFNNDGTKAYITMWDSLGGSDPTKHDYVWQFDLSQHVNRFEYKNTVLITENEYQCTMTEDEFEFTANNSIRKIPFSDSEDIANFATGSHFKPYVTSVGLYDDDGNLLVVGKLGQPIKASSETDTTFVIRFDT